MAAVRLLLSSSIGAIIVVCQNDQTTEHNAIADCDALISISEWHLLSHRALAIEKRAFEEQLIGPATSRVGPRAPP